MVPIRESAMNHEGEMKIRRIVIRNLLSRMVMVESEKKIFYELKKFSYQLFALLYYCRFYEPSGRTTVC